ncbi:hypothetical protein [Microterricola viridarii]|uniref:Uncharacterized protein n=1 Tax=Microterricola viridarii TaxID=412690 RepID=A0A1H1VH88_9MICO|nr:hypothetical protein [Microterricola viridarii]SDS84218.1 hypothetical protein SAMN04489834_2265 [Microterricola viridarii]
MAVQATIEIDDDRWAKRPYGVKFDDPDCDSRFGRNGFTSRGPCHDLIEQAKAAGFDVAEVLERFY